MSLGQAERIQSIVECAASAVFGSAAALAALVAFNANPGQLSLFACAATAAVAAFSCNSLFDWQSKQRPSFFIPSFDVRELDPYETDELLLARSDRIEADPAELVLTSKDRVSDPPLPGDPLVLDDILEALGPDSRVVRLFDPAVMPTVGQMKSRIDGHLGAVRTVPDASQALAQALLELRRSLR